MKKEVLQFEDSNYFMNSSFVMSQSLANAQTLEQLQFDLNNGENDDNYYHILGKRIFKFSLFSFYFLRTKFWQFNCRVMRRRMKRERIAEQKRDSRNDHLTLVTISKQTCHTKKRAEKNIVRKRRKREEEKMKKKKNESKINVWCDTKQKVNKLIISVTLIKRNFVEQK